MHYSDGREAGTDFQEVLSLPRDYEVKERIPVPHDNHFQSFFSSRHAILSFKLNDVTLTDQ